MTHELAYTRGAFLVDYGREVEEEIVRLQQLIEGKKPVEQIQLTLAGSQTARRRR